MLAATPASRETLLERLHGHPWRTTIFVLVIVAGVIAILTRQEVWFVAGCLWIVTGLCWYGWYLLLSGRRGPS